MSGVKDKSKIANKIKEARKEKGWTLDELGKKMSITKATVHQAESGRSGYSFATIQKFAEVLEKPITYFFEWEEKAINEDLAEYKIITPDLQKIHDLLLNHPETRKKILNYLKQYSEGKAARLSEFNGFLDALTKEQKEEILKKVPDIIESLRND